MALARALLQLVPVLLCPSCPPGCSPSMGTLAESAERWHRGTLPVGCSKCPLSAQVVLGEGSSTSGKAPAHLGGLQDTQQAAWSESDSTKVRSPLKPSTAAPPVLPLLSCGHEHTAGGCSCLKMMLSLLWSLFPSHTPSCAPLPALSPAQPSPLGWPCSSLPGLLSLLHHINK